MAAERVNEMLLAWTAADALFFGDQYMTIFDQDTDYDDGSIAMDEFVTPPEPR
jgi:hypothetical protein